MQQDGRKCHRCSVFRSGVCRSLYGCLHFPTLFCRQDTLRGLSGGLGAEQGNRFTLPPSLSLSLRVAISSIAVFIKRYGVYGVLKGWEVRVYRRFAWPVVARLCLATIVWPVVLVVVDIKGEAGGVVVGTTWHQRSERYPSGCLGGRSTLVQVWYYFRYPVCLYLCGV